VTASAATPAGPAGPAGSVGSITVPGRGIVAVDPDIAVLRLGVVVIRPTAAEARSSAASTMQAVLGSLTDGGVERRDLRTTLVGLDAVRDYSSASGPTVTGYQLTNTVEATIRAVAGVGEAIDAALAAGATSMDGLSFRVADPSAALAEARRRAMADARARAATLAAEAGVALGGVIAIVECGTVEPGPPRPMAEMRMKAMDDAATPVEAGSDELEIGVTVTFAIA
jgi:uncharacterized protein YggE